MDKLKVARKKIDKIDIQILELISARSKLAKEVIAAKGGANIFDPRREEKLIKNLVFKAKKLTPDYIENIWRLFIIENLYLQGGLKVFVGPEKEVEETSKWYFGKSATIKVCSSNFDAINKLSLNKNSAAVVKSTKNLSETFDIDGFKIKKVIETPIFKKKLISKVLIYKRLDEIQL